MPVYWAGTYGHYWDTLTVRETPPFLGCNMGCVLYFSAEIAVLSSVLFANVPFFGAAPSLSVVRVLCIGGSSTSTPCHVANITGGRVAGYVGMPV